MKNFLIIGNSAAGIAAVEAIRRLDRQSKVTVLSDEEYPAYCRCLLSYYLAGEVKEEKLLYRAADFYKENNAELILNKKVERVDPKKNRVTCADKSQINYDSLLIATGASPRIPEIKGVKKTNVFVFRTLKDCKDIAGQLPVAKAACVLGGGLVGLKAAYALKKRGIEVKVVVKSQQILSQMLDATAAGMLQRRLEENGIELLLGQDAAEIIGEGGELKAVKLDSNKVFGCSLVVLGKGVRPNIDLVKDAGLKTGEGIIADELLSSSVPNIYVAGDVCESFDLSMGKTAVNALWPVAVEQGRIAGGNMAGANSLYSGSVGMNSIEFFGLPAVSLGIYRIDDPRAGLGEVKACHPKENIYKKFILRDNILIGAVLVGNIKNSGLFLRLIREKVDLSSVKDDLAGENFAYPNIVSLLRDKEKIYV